MENPAQHTLVTQSNIDGIVSAILLKHLEQIEDVRFVTQQEAQEKSFSFQDTDITVNLPFSRGVHQAYDYHDSSTLEGLIINTNHILDTTASSASSLIFSHFHEELKEDKTLSHLVNIANKESSHTLSTKERLEAYAHFEDIFHKQALTA